jgi:Na+/H+ antiporter NhaD/arsenite permease-like protein
VLDPTKPWRARTEIEVDSRPVEAAMAEASGSQRISLPGWLALLLGAAAVSYLIYYNVVHLHDGHAATRPHELPPLWGVGVLPFAALLGAIAVLPLLPWTRHWWESNLNRLYVALGSAAATLLYYLGAKGWSSLLPVLNHAVPAEYIPFIVLLFSLYVISGGISLRGNLAARPMTNAGILAFGALIASFIGTTGASMLLIRPLLQTNAERKHVVHTVVFFIFLVSNIGGTLLPIGDPPLFLGYLRGVSFFWTLGLWPAWAFCCGILLVIYFVLDSYLYRKEDPSRVRLDEAEVQPLRLYGWINVLWLAAVVACVATVSHEQEFLNTGWTPFPFMRELLMLILVGISLATTPSGVREANDFNYAAILEVAALFIGIFIAMQLPIEVLNIRGPSLGLSEPWHFYWATGSLSSVLDNAPTYVVFFETANSLTPQVMETTVIREDLLIGISLGAVFMGAMTYIGNGPNFMVKAIAEQSGIPMPSFFGYMLRYSIPLLIPVFILVTFVFLRGVEPVGLEAAGGAPAEVSATHIEPAPAPHGP